MVIALTGELLWPTEAILKLRRVSNCIMMNIPNNKCFSWELLQYRWHESRKLEVI